MLQKARILLDQNRYTDAEKEIARALVLDPQDDKAYGLLARLKIEQELPEEAFEHLSQALQINPEEDYYIYLRALAHYQLDMGLSAIADLDSAIEMNPYNSGYFGLYAYVLIHEKRFQEALEKANIGLSIDAEDNYCLNARSTALNKMGKTEDAIETMRYSLATDPENEFTHATIGWNFLEKGLHKKANEHFRESLRINPSNNEARDGLKESLKSNIPPYRWLLMYGMWLHNKGRGVQLGLTLGLYLTFRFVAGTLSSLPVPYNYLGILFIILYLLLVFCSWLINPIANFLLSFHKEGRYAITRSERINGQTTTATLLVALVFTIGYMLTNSGENLNGLFLKSAITAAGISLAFSKITYPLKIGKTSTPEWIAVSFVLTGITVLIVLALSPSNGNTLFALYAIAIVIASWLNALSDR